MSTPTAKRDHVDDGIEEPAIDHNRETLLIHPTIKPLLIKAAILAFGSLLVISYLYADPDALGTRDATNVAMLAVIVLAAIGMIRYFITMIILHCTEYGVTEKSVWRDFRLLRRRKRRAVPYDLLRSCELDQGRVEATLGYGTISMNQGLGTLKLVNVEDPDEVFERIQGKISSKQV